jgi:hypothetical protein
MIRSIQFLFALFCFFAAGLPGAEAADPADISARPELAGDYDLVVEVPGAGRVDGRGEVMLNGQVYDLFRTAPNGVYATGFGMEVDGILGAVIVPFPRDYTAKIGLVMYRIDGGFLKGYRLSERGQQRVVGLEELAGPAGLNGRYEFTLSTGEGAPHYSGFVEIWPVGQVYRLQWFAPGPGAWGVGVKVGNLLIAAYGEKDPAGVVAYCIGPDWMVGIGGWPSRETLSNQAMVRSGKALPPPLTSLPGACP